MSIDEQLLARNNRAGEDNNEAVLAGNFRENQRGNTIDDNNPVASLREMKKAEMPNNQESEEDPKGLKGKIAEKMSPFLAMTDRLLQASWTNLITSFGLTLIWIDIHFFMNKVLGPMAFRELGEEWVPDHVKKLGGEKVKEQVAMMKKTEEIGCGCLNLGCLLVLIALLSVISMIAVAMEQPFETLWSGWLKGSLASFVEMIKSWL